MAQAQQTRIPAISIEVEGSIVTATFANGQKIVVDAAKLSPALYEQAALHGLKQKLGDAAAIARNTTTGASASLDDKYEAMLEVADRLNDPNGTWNKTREGGSGNGGNAGQLVRALMELTSKSKAQIEEFLETKSKEEKAALRANPKVAEIIVRMQAAASAQKGMDSDELLGELM